MANELAGPVRQTGGRKIDAQHEQEAAAMTEPIRVFTARRIHTMDPSLPEATAIAVRDGRVIEVGSVESLDPWLSRHDHEIVEP